LTRFEGRNDCRDEIFKRFLKTVSDGADVAFCGRVSQSEIGVWITRHGGDADSFDIGCPVKFVLYPSAGLKAHDLEKSTPTFSHRTTAFYSTFTAHLVVVKVDSQTMTFLAVGE